MPIVAGKLFIGGINKEVTTDESLCEHFSKYGELTDFIVMKTPTGRSRGFGFVTFKDRTTVDEVLGERHHTLDSKLVDVKLCKEEGSLETNRFQPGSFPSTAQQLPTPGKDMRADKAYIEYVTDTFGSHLSWGDRRALFKVFVGGLTGGTTLDSLAAAGLPYGNVIDSAIVTNRTANVARNFGFIQFDSREAVERVVASQRILVDGKYCDCREAIAQRVPLSEGEAEPDMESTTRYAGVPSVGFQQPSNGQSVNGQPMLGQSNPMMTQSIQGDLAAAARAVNPCRAKSLPRDNAAQPARRGATVVRTTSHLNPNAPKYCARQPPLQQQHSYPPLQGAPPPIYPGYFGAPYYPTPYPMNYFLSGGPRSFIGSGGMAMATGGGGASMPFSPTPSYASTPGQSYNTSSFSPAGFVGQTAQGGQTVQGGQPVPAQVGQPVPAQGGQPVPPQGGQPVPLRQRYPTPGKREQTPHRKQNNKQTKQQGGSSNASPPTNRSQGSSHTAKPRQNKSSNNFSLQSQSTSDAALTSIAHTSPPAYTSPTVFNTSSQFNGGGAPLLSTPVDQPADLTTQDQPQFYATGGGYPMGEPQQPYPIQPHPHYQYYQVYQTPQGPYQCFCHPPPAHAAYAAGPPPHFYQPGMHYAGFTAPPPHLMGQQFYAGPTSDPSCQFFDESAVAPPPPQTSSTSSLDSPAEAATSPDDDSTEVVSLNPVVNNQPPPYYGFTPMAPAPPLLHHAAPPRPGLIPVSFDSSASSLRHEQNQLSSTALSFMDGMISNMREHEKSARVDSQMQRMMAQMMCMMSGGDAAAGARNKVTETIVEEQEKMLKMLRNMISQMETAGGGMSNKETVEMARSMVQMMEHMINQRQPGAASRGRSSYRSPTKAAAATKRAKSVGGEARLQPISVAALRASLALPPPAAGGGDTADLSASDNSQRDSALGSSTAGSPSATTPSSPPLVENDTLKKEQPPPPPPSRGSVARKSDSRKPRHNSDTQPPLFEEVVVQIGGGGTGDSTPAVSDVVASQPKPKRKEKKTKEMKKRSEVKKTQQTSTPLPTPLTTPALTSEPLKAPAAAPNIVAPRVDPVAPREPSRSPPLSVVTTPVVAAAAPPSNPAERAVAGLGCLAVADDDEDDEDDSLAVEVATCVASKARVRAASNAPAKTSESDDETTTETPRTKEMSVGTGDGPAPKQIVTTDSGVSTDDEATGGAALNAA